MYSLYGNNSNIGSKEIKFPTDNFYLASILLTFFRHYHLNLNFFSVISLIFVSSLFTSAT